MSLYKKFDNGDALLPDRRAGIFGSVLNSFGRTEQGTRVVTRKGRRFGRIVKPSSLVFASLLSALLLISVAVFLLKFHVPGIVVEREISTSVEAMEMGDNRDGGGQSSSGNTSIAVTGLPRPGGSGASPPRKHRKQHYPCEVGFSESVNYLLEPMEVRNFTQFSLQYVVTEERPSGPKLFDPRFGGHQSLEEKERSFYARDQKLDCGFVKDPIGTVSSGFDLDEKDKSYMSTCLVVVSSCIFGSFDFLRRPTARKMSEFSKKNVCFVMFVDEQTLSKLSLEGHVPDENGFVGLWRIVVVRNLPYKDMRKTGKVPKFLSHRLFPSSRYSIWVDSKMRLNADPLLIIEYFLWRKRSEYAISNHYDRHCVWEEVLQNKRLNKYNHMAIDEQFNFYQNDGLTKFDYSNTKNLLPSYVPEGSFIVRAHTPMSNLFSCLWFNEVDRFTSRDQLSFAYTYLKLKRLNPDRPFHLNMFKDCERRALAKLFRHRIESLPPPTPA